MDMPPLGTFPPVIQLKSLVMAVTGDLLNCLGSTLNYVRYYVLPVGGKKHHS